MRVPMAMVVMFFAAGCPAPMATPSGPIAFDAFPAEAARANCRLLFDCCTASEVSGVFTPGMPVANEAECRTYYEMYFRSEGSAAQGHIAAGMTRWDADAAGACIGAIDAATCPDILGGVLVQPVSLAPSSEPSCQRRFTGLGGAGAACGADLDCASGFCRDGGTTRACALLPGEGEACTDRCATGLGCDVRAASPTCVVRRPDGASCTPGFGDVCESRNCNAPGMCGARAPITLCGATR